MASFDGVSFKVIPDGSFYPQPVEESGITKYTCEVHFASLSVRNSMAAKVGVVTELRSLGTKSVTVVLDVASVDAGTLVIPTYGGGSSTHTAILTNMTDSKGYGRAAIREATAKLDFTIIGSTTITAS